MGTEFRVQNISPEHKGVLPRVMEEVFERVAVLESTSQTDCTLSLSYLEVRCGSCNSKIDSSVTEMTYDVLRS